jgi:hypothetical protein
MPHRATVAQRKRDTVRKNLAQGAGGFPRKRLVMADKWMPCRATVARRKRAIIKSYITQEKCRPRREWVASRTRTAHHAGVIGCKENAIGRVRARDNVVQGTRKGWTPRWRQLICQEGTKETMNRDFADQLRLESKWTPWRG